MTIEPGELFLAPPLGVYPRLSIPFLRPVETAGLNFDQLHDPLGLFAQFHDPLGLNFDQLCDPLLDPDTPFHRFFQFGKPRLVLDAHVVLALEIGRKLCLRPDNKLDGLIQFFRCHFLSG